MRTRRFLILLVVISLLAVAAGGVAYYLSVRNLVLQEHLLRAEATCRLISEEIVTDLAGRKRGVRLLAESPALGLLLQQADTLKLNRVNNLLDFFQEVYGAAVCYLLDGEGRTVASSNREEADSFVGKSYAFRPYFQQAIKGKPASLLALGVTSKKRGIYVSYPVTSEGAILGVAVMKFPLTALETRLAAQKEVMALLDPAGMVFASNRQDWLYKKLLSPPGKAMAAGLTNRVGGPVGLAAEREGGLVRSSAGKRYLLASHGLGDFAGWRLVCLDDISGLGRQIVAGLLNPTGYALLAMLLLVLAGALSLFLLAGRELGRREDTERKLAQANAVLRQVFHSAAVGLRIIGAEYTIMMANKTFEEISGLPVNEIKGRKCYEVFPGPACHTPDCPWDRIMAQGQPSVSQEVNKRRVDGGEIVCLVEAVPFRNAAGKVVGILENVRDISEWAHTERQMEKAITEAHLLAEQVAASNDLLNSQKQELEIAYAKLKETQSQILQQEKMASIGQLAAGVAHEINNPMGFITSNLSTLIKYVERLTRFTLTVEKQVQQAGGEEALAALEQERQRLKIDYIIDDLHDLIRESLDGANRVRKIVQGLKSFSRVDQAAWQSAHINECLDTTINMVWNELKYKAEIRKEYGELPLTVCNPQQLNQVFMNLLINASQAIDRQGVITVKTWREDDWIMVSISDTGRGIAREHLNRIFEPFFTTKEVGQGTGLGLSIAYDIVVKKHKGDITVTSEPGQGTTFRVKIPVIDETDSFGRLLTDNAAADQEE